MFFGIGGQRLEGRTDRRHLAFLVFEPVLNFLRQIELEQRRRLRIENHRRAGINRVVALLGNVVGEDRRHREDSDHDASVASGDRPATVDRLRRPAAQRGLGQRREHQGKADPDHHLWRHGQRDLRLWQQRQPAEPTGDEDRAGGGPRPGARHEAVKAAAEQRGQRHHADHDRCPDRAQAPAFDQQQHEQEEGTGDRRRDQGQGQIGEEVRPAGPAQLGREHPGGGLMPGDSQNRHRCGEGDRHLDQEDRLPGDQLGEQTPDRRPQGGPRRPSGRPQCRGAALGADRGRQQLEHGRHCQCAADRLHATSRDQRAELIREGAGEPRSGEDREPDSGRAAGANTARQVRGGHGSERHHQVEGNEYPADAGDASVELPIDIGQGEDDDRGVGQDEADGERQRRDAGSGGLGVQ